jgi:hypothetical protein
MVLGRELKFDRSCSHGVKGRSAVSGKTHLPRNSPSGTLESVARKGVSEMNSSNSRELNPGENRWLVVIPTLGVLGIIGIALFASQAPGSWKVFSTGLLVAGSSGAVGGIVGFLFGIPRSPQETSGANTQYQANTNLEQVSDWLTKILVGVGLVQLARAPSGIGRLADDLKVPLGDLPSSAGFGLALVIGFAILGFLFLYLWARIALPRELPTVAAAVAQALSQVDSKDTKALSLTNQQLSPQGGPSPAQVELNAAVLSASTATKIQIFNQAERCRADNRSTDKPRMGLAEPIFRALIASDSEQAHHRAHGSLGWLLKDKDPPNWSAARDELTTAIRIRDAHGIPGWGLYEANRALCNINLDPAKGTSNPTNPKLVELINNDLRVASADDYAKQMVAAVPDIQAWLKANPL